MKILTILLIMCATTVFGQDAPYSNIFNNPLQLNPALTGQIGEKAQRLVVGSRDQWRSFLGSGAFHTSFASFDKRICLPNTSNEFFGLGVNIQADETGNSPYRRLDLMLSGSYFKKISETGRNGFHLYAGVGLEAGFIHHRLGNGDLTFDEQFDDPNALGEHFDNSQFTKPDVGVGISLNLSKPTLNNFGIQIGGAIKHLAEPKYEFFEVENGEEARLNRRYTSYITASIPLRNDDFGFYIKTAYLYQNPYNQLMAHLGLFYQINERVYSAVGGGWRLVRIGNETHSDAFILSTSLHVEPFSITFSYDGNISGLRNASQGVGAFEVIIGLTFGAGNCNQVYCPEPMR